MGMQPAYQCSLPGGISKQAQDASVLPPHTMHGEKNRKIQVFRLRRKDVSYETDEAICFQCLTNTHLSHPTCLSVSRLNRD